MAGPKRPSDLAEKMLIRLPEGMRDRIAEAATASGRSMNAEVVARLEASFEHDETQATLDELQEEYEKVQVSVESLDKQFKAYLSERQTMQAWMKEAIEAVFHGQPAPPMPAINIDPT